MISMISNNTLANLAQSLGLLLFLKSSLVLLIGAGLVWWQQGTSAASRYSTWCLVLALLLILPLVATTLPHWNLLPGSYGERPLSSAGVAPASELNVGTSDVVSHPVDQPLLRDGGRSSVASEAPVASQLGPQTVSSRVSFLAAAFVGLWLAGVMVMALRLQRDMATAHDLIRQGNRLPAERITTLVQQLRTELDIKRQVRVRVGDTIQLPFSWGILRPQMVLPLEARDWPDAQLRSVVAHELAHIARWDHLLLLLVELTRVLYWPNPLVWLAVRRCSLEREWSCDDEVISRGVASDQYATHLVAVARSQVRYAAAIGMADPGGLAKRVDRVMNNALDRSRITSAGFISLVFIALLVLVPVATLGLSRASRELPTTDDLLVILTDDEDPGERRFAAWWLGEHENRKAVRPLMRSLTDESADVRLVAGWALGEIKDDRSIDPLIDALDDADPFVREMAALALGEIENPDAIDALEDAAARSPELCKPVIWALGEIGTRQARKLRDQLFDELGRREYDNQQVWAGDLPVRYTRSGRKAERGYRISDDLDELLDDLKSDDPETRQAAAFGIGMLGLNGDLDSLAPVEPLLDLLRDPVPAVRAVAIWSLDEINPSRWRRVHH